MHQRPRGEPWLLRFCHCFPAQQLQVGDRPTIQLPLAVQDRRQVSPRALGLEVGRQRVEHPALSMDLLPRAVQLLVSRPISPLQALQPQ